MATDLATLQTRLQEAEFAYHALMTGQRRASVSRAGTSVAYFNTADSIASLKAYIGELKNEIAAATTGRPRRSVIYTQY